MRRILLGATALFLSAASAVFPAAAQDWPTQPITIVMGFPPGSGIDVVARILQPLLDKALGQRIVIDYKAGAGGNVASDFVANAKPDGYTFLLGTAGDARHQCRALHASFRSTSRRTSRRSRPWSTCRTCWRSIPRRSTPRT